nr:PD-(D/E)XK nuclease family protein [Kineosporia babensis]
MHRHLAAAFASATTVWASFPRGDLRRSVSRLPSRWLLPTLRALTNTPNLSATKWDTAKGDAVIGSHSFWDEIRRSTDLATEHEWRVREVSSGAELQDDVIAAATDLQKHRSSTAFTRFDGNLRDVEGLPDYARSGRTISPTTLEAYATCPHTFFVSRLLGVRPLSNPDEIIKISPADIGTLMHTCIDRLVQTFADNLPDHGRPWVPAQRYRLREIAEQTSDEFEQRGLTGHRLLWEHERAQILVDLDAMLDADNEHRAKRDARVLGSELRFGMNGLDPVRINVSAGVVHMSGSADKVDQTRDGVLLVCDIKTGSNTSFKEIETDPIVRGTKLQLPVYAHAARARYGSDDVEASFWFVRKDRRRIRLPLDDDLNDVYSQAIGTLVQSIADGLFPAKAPEEADFGWTRCEYCNPDGLGHSEARSRYETKRHDERLRSLMSLIDPTAVQGQP